MIYSGRPAASGSDAAGSRVHPVSITLKVRHDLSNTANWICCIIIHLKKTCVRQVHPVSITRFPLRRFSPGAGLLRYVFFIGSGLRFSRGWVRKEGDLLTETGCTSVRPSGSGRTRDLNQMPSHGSRSLRPPRA